ncbi:hypothetical protein M3Y94_00740600 [Aphelenchoides besseyi]|nr:hypothetical protein M3Y94_00740600 [Aphelenchoides besseyi]KAI6231977.1 hypothetical protein M3Y95_00438400 [Aphelenchoides besseyi]
MVLDESTVHVRTRAQSIARSASRRRSCLCLMIANVTLMVYLVIAFFVVSFVSRTCEIKLEQWEHEERILLSHAHEYTFHHCQYAKRYTPFFADYCAENCGKSAFLWRQLRLDFSFNDSSCLPIQQQLACHSSSVVYCRIPQRTKFSECLGFANTSMGNFDVGPTEVLVPRLNQSVLEQLGSGTYLLANQLIAQCPRCRIKSQQFRFSNDPYGCYSLLQTQTSGWPFQFHTCDLVTNQAAWNNSTKCSNQTINLKMPEGTFIPIFPLD